MRHLPTTKLGFLGLLAVVAITSAACSLNADEVFPDSDIDVVAGGEVHHEGTPRAHDPAPGPVQVPGPAQVPDNGDEHRGQDPTDDQEGDTDQGERDDNDDDPEETPTPTRTIAVDLDDVCATQYGSAAENTSDTGENRCDEPYLVPDVQRFCRDVHLGAADHETSEWDSWQCTYLEEILIDVSIETACREQHNEPTAKAIAADPAQATSWYCEVNGVNIGGVDVKRYCEDRGWELRLLPAEDAGSWKCFGLQSRPITVPVDYDALCSHQGHGHDLVLRHGDTHDSLVCWKVHGRPDAEAYCADMGGVLAIGPNRNELQCEIY